MDKSAYVNLEGSLVAVPAGLEFNLYRVGHQVVIASPYLWINALSIDQKIVLERTK